MNDLVLVNSLNKTYHIPKFADNSIIVTYHIFWHHFLQFYLVIHFDVFV